MIHERIAQRRAEVFARRKRNQAKTELRDMIKETHARVRILYYIALCVFGFTIAAYTAIVLAFWE